MGKVKNHFWWIAWNILFLTVCGFCVFVQWTCGCSVGEMWAITACIILAWNLQKIHLKDRELAAKDQTLRENKKTIGDLVRNVIRAHKNREPS